MVRKLASIRKISAIRPIENADMIECVQIDGWEVVTAKNNNFQVGDKVVYFEIDSLLPQEPLYEFLRKSSYVSEMKSINGPGFRIRTVKMRGQISQGIIFPLNKFENLQELEEGTDLTEMLGVKKFEKPVPTNLDGIAIGFLPYNIPKTDEERIQNCYEQMKDKLETHEWEVSIKLNGASMTVYYDNTRDHVGVCSRNTEFQETAENGLWKVARRYEMVSKLRSLGRNIAVQGEIIGPGNQGNQEKLKELDFYVFKIFDTDTQRFLSPKERLELTESLGFKHVPVLEATNFSGYTLQELLQYAAGPSLNPGVDREGLVFKSLTDSSTSFKVISNSWLLKTGE